MTFQDKMECYRKLKEMEKECKKDKKMEEYMSNKSLEIKKEFGISFQAMNMLIASYEEYKKKEKI